MTDFVPRDTIPRKQLERIHRALPEDWTPRDEVRKIVAELLNLEHDQAAQDGLLTSLSLAGVAQHAKNSTLWRRGTLPPAVSAHERYEAAQKRARERARVEEEEALARRHRAEKRQLEFAMAPQKAQAFGWIDERVGEWLLAVGYTEEQVAAARGTLPVVQLSPPLVVDPPRTLTSLPPGAVVTEIKGRP